MLMEEKDQFDGFNFSFNAEERAHLDDAIEHFKSVYDAIKEHGSLGWSIFAKTLVLYEADANLRLIHEAYTPCSLTDYLHNGSLQRKTSNALKSIDALYYVFQNVFPLTRPSCCLCRLI